MGSRLPERSVKRFVNLRTEIAELINIETETIVCIRAKSKSFFFFTSLASTKPEKNPPSHDLVGQQRAGECFMTNESPPINRSVRARLLRYLEPFTRGNLLVWPPARAERETMTTESTESS